MNRFEKTARGIVFCAKSIQHFLFQYLLSRVRWGERVQHVVTFLSLYYLCDTIMQGRTIFAGLQRSEWLTYIGVVHLLRATILKQTEIRTMWIEIGGVTHGRERKKERRNSSPIETNKEGN